MQYNLYPSFKAIRYFERMTNISFFDLDKNPNLILNLVYCCLIAHPENNFKMTFDEAVEKFFPNHAEKLVNQFLQEMEVMNQFTVSSTPSDDNSIDSSVKASPNEEEHMLLSSLIPILIMDCKLDANFVLNELDYTDSKLYIDKSISNKHEEMEDKRLWTYIEVAPHLSSKAGIKEAKDLVEFTWEKEEKKKEAEEKMKRDRKRLIELGFIKEEENKTLEE